MTIEDILQLKTPDDLWHYMHKNIKYGWTNKYGEYRDYGDSRMFEEYYFHSPKETIERKSGLCGDQVLLEKMWFDYKKIENHIITFGFKNNDGKKMGGGHTFLVYIKDNKYYYFENAFMPCANIVEFDSFDELVGTVIASYLIVTNNTDKINNLFITIDGHIKINSTTQQNYEETLNDIDYFDKYEEQINNGLKKFQ